MHSITISESARMRRDDLVADAARARRVRVGRARSTPRAWGWRRGHLVPVPRPVEQLNHARGARVDHATARQRHSNRATAPPDEPSSTAT